ncbi:hypothetical protein [Vallitalea guaymasensis]|uniref:hypothetical protein n=1 Tax=Vallitalea guaymasensis TaxID=1185412 RepID=UPI000DE3FE7F|nr:hypothetical protein [Vallitalea guaymasensis]
MKKRIFFVILSILLIVILLYKFLPKNNYKDIGITGALVFKKEINNNNYFIIVNHFNQNTDDILTVKIKVDDENTWNLIETNNFYTISYSNQKSKEFILQQIEIANKNFQEMYGNKFINYKKEQD